MANYMPVFVPHHESSSNSSIPNPVLLEQQSTLIGNALYEQAVDMSGTLEVTIHRARDIHNICIYGNQDVYAKFLIPQIKSQDAVYSTAAVKSGGQNPIFNQTLEIPILGGWDANLRCELWMMSCARNYLEDQLLGFVLIPLKSLCGKEGKWTQEYCLTSTDLFHTPAGMVQLSLSYNDHSNTDFNNIHHETDKMLLQEGPSSLPQSGVDADEVERLEFQRENLGKIEFVDLDAASEDQHLMLMYYKMVEREGYKESTANLPGDELGQYNPRLDNCKARNGKINVGYNDKAIPRAAEIGNVEDGMVWSPSERKCTGSNGHVPKEKMCSLPDSESYEITLSPGDSITVAMEHVQPSPSTTEIVFNSSLSMETQHTASSSTSCCIGDGNGSLVVAFEVQEKNEDVEISTPKGLTESSPFTATTPLVSISLEPEVSINQEHFVDLYLKSMQQFTEKLADMKFSFDVDAQEASDPLQEVSTMEKEVSGGKKEASKLYYGSRAFF